MRARIEGVFMRISSHTRLLTAAAFTLCITVSAYAQQAAPATQGTAYLNRQMAALTERQGAAGWYVTPTGLRWRRIAGDGSGAKPGPTDEVTVHYVGTFPDGREFDSSVRRGEPTTFPLNRVIPGWQEGVALMGVGDKVELAIPWQLAYGADGKGPIPGGATLLFTVELLSLEPAG
jgi:FKBP-type peptidyl-prolyl cis-trans isomerase FkpA